VYVYIHTCLDIDRSIKMLSLVYELAESWPSGVGYVIYIRVCIYMYTCVYVCIRVCIYMYTCIDIDIQKKIISRKWWSHGLLARYV